MSELTQEQLTAMRERDSARQGRWACQSDVDLHDLLAHVDRLVLRLSSLLKRANCGGYPGEACEEWPYCAHEPDVTAMESRLHQLSEDHSHCEGLLHELGARASTAEGRLGTLRTLAMEAVLLQGHRQVPADSIWARLALELQGAAVEKRSNKADFPGGPLEYPEDFDPQTE